MQWLRPLRLLHPMRHERSLKARAVDFLSRREHSRLELQRKLARYADDPNEVEVVLSDLERQGLLSNDRFARSLVHRRAGKLGTSRIVQELRQHGVSAEQVAELRGNLQESEVSRAQAVWQKRYGRAPADAADRARQMRFLAARGFGNDTIRKVMSGAGEESTDEFDPFPDD
nr:recombination regulator RecX [Pseudomonas sp.]